MQFYRAMKIFCIINLKALEPAIGGHLLSKRFGPTCFYDDLDDAAEELFRLQKKYPGGEFFIFESVAWAKKSPTVKDAWHIEPVTT